MTPDRESEIRRWIDSVRSLSPGVDPVANPRGLSNPNAAPVMELLSVLDKVRAERDDAEQRGRAIEREAVLSFLESWYCDDNAALDEPTTMRDALTEAYEEILSGEHLEDEEKEP